MRREGTRWPAGMDSFTPVSGKWPPVPGTKQASISYLLLSFLHTITFYPHHPEVGNQGQVAKMVEQAPRGKTRSCRAQSLNKRSISFIPLLQCNNQREKS